MGISPVGGDRVIPEVEDTPQSRWGSIVEDSKATGEIVGGEIGEVVAEAGSANDSAQQLAKDLTEVEKRVKGLEEKFAPDLSSYAKKSDLDSLAQKSELTSLASKQYVDDAVKVTNSASGTGWRVTRVGRLVAVDITGATANFTIPTGFLPLGLTYISVTGAAGAVGRVSINPTSGAANITNITGAVYGNGSYFTT